MKIPSVLVSFLSQYHFRNMFIDNGADLVDLLSIYSAVDQVGVHRVGIADTVGVSSNHLLLRIWSNL